ncbi:hypothetical protein RB599_010055 [Gaeumannomyces hyphopodioides]
MQKHYKGDMVFSSEKDERKYPQPPSHGLDGSSNALTDFPHLTVGQTLGFAVAARASRKNQHGKARTQYIEDIRAVVMAAFGLSHTVNTKVGSDFIRGVSGGERKRVSLAEMSVDAPAVSCWDNPTRGLDSAASLRFAQALRTSADIFNCTHAVCLYQTSQVVYASFDKVLVLYEGRQIFFGPIQRAKAYFEDMGWLCPPRQTTPDFLTGITNPAERLTREGFEAKVPRMAEEFEVRWRASHDFQVLRADMEQYDRTCNVGLESLKNTYGKRKAVTISKNSPFVASVFTQVRICVARAYQRLWGEMSATATTLGGQIVFALVIGSTFHGLVYGTQSLAPKTSSLFYAILLNTIITEGEVTRMFEQRPIVDKHKSYGLYHPFAEALATTLADVPVKIIGGVVFNTILYFLAGYKQDAGAFFIYLLVNVLTTFAMSQCFRAVGSASKTLDQALSVAGVLLLAFVIYSGFVIPMNSMPDWFVWIAYINPLYYAFEALVTNELHNVNLPCSDVVPSYPGFVSGVTDTFVCNEKGAQAGELFVNCDRFLKVAYGYEYANLWRNVGIICGFLVAFFIANCTCAEFNSLPPSKPEALIFCEGHAPKSSKDSQVIVESLSSTAPSESKPSHDRAFGSTFSWRNVSLDIKTKNKETRRLLNEVSGWVKPGTLTALMGVSGAGKTTLLNTLAQRIETGVVAGDMLVDGHSLAASFQRTAGYVQQQDVHLDTMTVREALQFSAMLRQPRSVPKEEKLAFVEEVIIMLNMQEFTEAVVGQVGEGLSLEQRKLVSIGVELVAKPSVLLFLDEPTSGLDSQSSWSIIQVLRRLANNGQAILATIHQPSALLFQQFDKLLFLGRGGNTIYFGDIGQNSSTLLDYLHSKGARPCREDENPAEYLLDIPTSLNAAGEAQDWPEIWRQSEEAAAMKLELDRLSQPVSGVEGGPPPKESEYAAPFTSQVLLVTRRVFQQYWRTPGYVYGKFTLGLLSALFIAFSFFQPKSSMMGLQMMIFAVFMLTAMFGTVVQQLMPQFIKQRSVYEVRERPSKIYHWAAFIIANIVVEIPFQIALAITVYASFTYPIFGIVEPENQIMMLLFSIQFFVFASTFGQVLVAGLPDVETAATIANMMFNMTVLFNGVMITVTALPGFWQFMYYVSPATYLVKGIVAAGVSGRLVTCSNSELRVFQPADGLSCGAYMEAYLSAAGADGAGSLLNPNATTDCEYCPLAFADQYLAHASISLSEGWRNLGIGWAYVMFNIVATLVVYYFRIRR